MKNIIALIVCASLGLVLLAGCSSTGSNSAAPMTDSIKVGLLFSPPTKAYSDVCAVSVVKMQPSGETWQSAMQKQAAAHGADAVIVDSTTVNNNTSTVITGKAIRYQ